MCAFLAMALAHQMELRDAVEVGWNASSLYIESKHNKPIMPHEFANWNDPIKSKIVSVEDMKTIMGYCKCQWTWTNGCHDFAIHGGHLKVLEYAKRLGDKVIVGLNTDNSVKKLKGDNRPYLTYKQRAENLAHLQYVDFIVPIEEETPLSIIKQLPINYIVKGGDYTVEQIAGSDIVGYENVHLVPLIDGISTTKLMKELL
jgi:D-beta-D-heptose 7-phosphate kinase/D-beta-D-heptose 1-phosphate adenosyltransferase